MHRILLVDDSEALSKAFSLRLRHAGYDVATAHDVDEGFERALDFAPSIAILDINLPSGSGIELAGRLLAEMPVRIIFATASGDCELNAKAKGLGAIALLVKPFDASLLLQTVNLALTTTAVH